MERSEVYNQLNEIFQDVFDNEEITVDDSTTAEDVEGWDSNMHITLIAEVEDSFDIHFEMRDVAKMHNVGEMVDKIIELIQQN
ncbi:MAG: acyl carrier protein [Blautia sp.]|nr:acyl carrier protein [Blautia sp.]